MRVKFWGTRGSIPSPGNDTIKYGGNTTCLTVNSDRDDFNPLIIDAGTGIRLLGEKLLESGRPLHLTIVFTHSHWDHIQGFPFFRPAYSPHDLIDIYTCPWLGGAVKDSLFVQMDTRNFPISYDSLKAEIAFHQACDENKIMGMEISTIKLNHPGSGMGFRFTDESGSFAFITDHELEAEPYIGAGLKETIEFCRGADLLIHDAQYLRDEMSRYKGWGHSAIEDVFELALEAEVKKLALFHHNPTRPDREIDEIVSGLGNQIEERKLSLDCIAAREGAEIVIGR